MFKYRAISFPLLLALAALVVFWEKGGHVLFAVLAPIVFLLAVFEMANLAGKVGISSSRKILFLAALGIILWVGAVLGRVWPDKNWIGFFDIVSMVGFFLLFFSFPVCWLLMLFSRDRNLAVQQALGTFGVLTFAAIPLLSLIVFYFAFGPLKFLAMVLITKAADTGGYIVGMLSGKLLPGGNHKIVPAISPKKSWEGTVGAAIFSIGVAAIFAACGVLTMPWYGVLIVGFVGFLGSFAGDLTESQLKRAANVKDSANWIPGMGGVWDVLDSFIYNAPLFLLAAGMGIF